MSEKQRDFCPECRKETAYTLQKEDIQCVKKGVEYTFKITEAICTECGARMSIPGLIDQNVREVEEQYQAKSVNLV